MIKNLILILIGFVINELVYTIIGLITGHFAKRRNRLKKRFCHHCEMAYIHDLFDGYAYCPYCGKPLQYIHDAKQFQPFEEFNEKENDEQ